MHRFRQHSWPLGLLTALLLAGVLQAVPAGNGACGTCHVADLLGSVPMPSSQAEGHGAASIGLPSHAHAATVHERTHGSGPDVLSESPKAHRYEDARRKSAEAATHLTGSSDRHAFSASRLHLFCVYRL